MKFYIQFILILIPGLIFLSCKPSEEKDARKLLEKHKYDFSNFKKVHYKGLNLKIPSYFRHEFAKAHLLQKEGLSLFNPETSIYISIERFDKYEVDDILFAFETGSQPLDALNTHYCDLRGQSLNNPKISVLLDNPKNSRLKGFYQYIEGRSRDYFMDNMMYMFSTVEKKINGENVYFVIQMIAPTEISKYLNDDFLRLISRAN